MPAKIVIGARLTLPRGRYRLRYGGGTWPPTNYDDRIYESISGTVHMSHDEDMTSKYSGDSMSLDDILTEFQLETGAELDPPAYVPGAYPAQAPSIGASFTDMEAEARRYMADMAAGGYQAQDAPAAPASGYTAFDGSAVDTGPEEDYSAPTTSYNVEDDAEPGYDYDYDYDQPEEDSRKKKKSLFGKKSKKDKSTPSVQEPRPEDEEDDDYTQSFRDYDGNGKEYAPDEDYDEPTEPEVFPPSFRDYLLSIVAGIFYRIRGTGVSPDGQTMSEDDEDLGPELSPAQASKYYGAHMNSLRLRLRISAVVWLLMCYVAFGLPVPGMLQYLPVAAALCLAMQLTVMLLSLDVVTTALLKLFRLRAGADSLAVLSCLLTALDALMVITGNGVSHMPLCVASSLSLIGVLFSSFISVRALRKALRVPAIGKRSYAVTGEINVTGSGVTLLKSIRPAKGFVRRSEEAAPDETLFTKAAPFILLLCLLLTAVIAIVKKDFYDLAFIASAVLAPAAPVTALTAFALPYLMGTLRIFKSGAAIAGWSGMCDIGQSKNLIVTDRDLFPDGSVEIDSIRIFADEDAETVMAFAGTMIAASGSSISSCFGELMEKNDCAMRQVMDFEYLAGGGMKGIIDGHVVMCGGSELMRLMNVRIPYRLLDKTSVLLSIDGVLYGIFNMKYTALPLVRQALVNLMRSNRHPVFAVRDFNITPEMLHDCFDVATDGYDFPPYAERFTISEARPSDNSKIAAVVCREGLGPLTSMADTGRSIYVVTRVNLLITALSALIGMLAVFLKLMLTGSVGLGFLLVFMLVWAIPVFILSIFMSS